MTKEFNLSEKIFREIEWCGSPSISVFNIKKFIRLVWMDCSEAFESNELEIVEEIIKKRAGDKLT